MNYSDFTVVIPTLNEEGNIAMLMERLTAAYSGLSIIVVDDDSEDRTSKIVRDFSKKNRRVTLIERKGKPRGLTASAAEGIMAAKTKFALVMDADMQHPIGAIKSIAIKLRSGNDLVIGVRADVKDWALYRKIISKTLITVAYAILIVSGKSRSKDIFSGFFGVDRRLFAQVYSRNRKRFVQGGYKILYDFLKCMRHKEMRIGEVPYSFGHREFGMSKAGFKQGMLLFKSFAS